MCVVMCLQPWLSLCVLAGACCWRFGPRCAGSSAVQRPEADWRCRRVWACRAAPVGPRAWRCCQAHRSCCAARACCSCGSHRRVCARAGAGAGVRQARSACACHRRDGSPPGACMRSCESSVQVVTLTVVCAGAESGSCAASRLQAQGGAIKHARHGAAGCAAALGGSAARGRRLVP